jgi:hypothetical protein
MYVPLLARTVIRTVIAAFHIFITPAESRVRPAFTMPR